MQPRQGSGRRSWSRKAPEAGGLGEAAYNGSAIGDKFRLSGWGQLRLSWPRAQVMHTVSPAATHPPDEQSHRGGYDKL
jgi:hypothetical protein